MDTDIPQPVPQPVPRNIRDVRRVPLGVLAGRSGEGRPEVPGVAFNSSL